MRDISNLIDPCEPRQDLFALARAVAINNAGQILLNMTGNRYGVLLTPYLPGDLDENEICDLQDLAIQLANFDRAGDATYEHGDLDCDHDVDLQDLAILLANFGESLP
jgi:hypothetical protein